MKRSQRKDVMYDTMAACEDRFYTTSKGQEVEIAESDLKDPVKGTVKYKGYDLAKLNKSPFLRKEAGDIVIINGECLDTALKYQEAGYNPVVLNMASAFKPGGGWESGAGAQEESLFRRTNLYQCLPYQKRLLYPIPRTGALYTPNAVVLKTSENDGYHYYSDVKKMSFIAAAAERVGYDRKGELKGLIEHEDGSTSLTKEVKDITRNKIKGIMTTAMYHGHDVVILSAFGCGAYNNPPEEIANLFKSVFKQMKYQMYFKKIVFAIINDKNSPTGGNIKPFERVFGIKATKI